MLGGSDKIWNVVNNRCLATIIQMKTGDRVLVYADVAPSFVF